MTSLSVQRRWRPSRFWAGVWAGCLAALCLLLADAAFAQSGAAARGDQAQSEDRPAARISQTKRSLGLRYVQRADGWWVAVPQRRLERSTKIRGDEGRGGETPRTARLFERSLPAEHGDAPIVKPRRQAQESRSSVRGDPPQLYVDRNGRWRYGGERSRAGSRPPPRDATSGLEVRAKERERDGSAL